MKINRMNWNNVVWKWFGIAAIVAALGVSSLRADFVGKVNVHDRIGNGWHMYTQVAVDDSGVISGTTRLRNYNNFRGFTGGLFVVVLDENDEAIYAGPVHRWGVNAAFFKKSRTRTVSWSDKVPDEFLALASSVAVVQKHTPTNRVWKWIYENRELLVEKALAFYDIIQKIKTKQLTEADVWNAVGDAVELIQLTESDAWLVDNLDKIQAVSYQIYLLAKKEGDGWIPENAEDVKLIVAMIKAIKEDGLDWEDAEDVRTVVREILALLGDRQGWFPENTTDLRIIVENVYRLVDGAVDIDPNVADAIEKALAFIKENESA